jgi:peptidoglycan/xylan/chitin deacetylase (PgdA/CDA1 family)
MPNAEAKVPMPDSARNVIIGEAATQAYPGYDHDWFTWSPLPSRHPVRWPRGKRTAVSVLVHLAAVEWEEAADLPPRPPGGRGIGVPPDVPRMSHREFGHRVGVFRLLRILGSFGIAPTAVVDVLTVEQYRPLLDHLLPATSEILAGGLSASRPITSLMSEDEERDYIGTTLDRLVRVLGSRPVGWLGPEHSESARTPALLAEADLRYVADWANDDMPYSFAGVGPDFWAFPLSWELSDLASAYLRMVAPDTWAESVMEAFDVVHSEGGRLLSLHLQPWLSGQAFRATSLERVLLHLCDADDVWFASPAEIVDHCRHQEGS